MSDHDVLIAGIVGGDPDAIASWIAFAEPRIRASLASFASTVDTESVMQECLLRVWQVAPRFKPDGEPDGLLRMAICIARNLAITETRRRRPKSVDPDDIETPMGVQIPEIKPNPLLGEAIERCLKQLPARPRLAIESRIEGAGQRDETLAAAVNMKLNTFLQNVRRARLMLLECLKRHGVNVRCRL